MGSYKRTPRRARSTTSGGGGNGIVSRLFSSFSSSPEVDEEASKIEPFDDSEFRATDDGSDPFPQPTPEQTLAQRGMSFPTYKTPGFGRNFLTGGAAGRAATDANMNSQLAKNNALSKLTSEQTHAQQIEREAQLRSTNAAEQSARDDENARNKVGYDVVGKAGLVPTKENVSTFDSSTMMPTLANHQADLAERTMESRAKLSKAQGEVTWHAAHPDDFQRNLSAVNNAPIVKESGELQRQAIEGAEAEPKLSELEYGVSRQPQRSAMEDAKIEEQTLANRATRSLGGSRPISSPSVLANPDGTFTYISGDHPEMTQVPIGTTGYTRSVKTNKPGSVVTLPDQRTVRAPGEAEDALLKAKKTRKFVPY